MSSTCIPQKIPFHKHLPSFEKEYQNTPENLEKVIRKVAALYALCLTELFHDRNGSLYKELHEKGVWTANGVNIYPSSEEKELFFQTLQCNIKNELDSFEASASLSVDWRPDRGILSEAENHITLGGGVNIPCYFPTKSICHISVKKDLIILKFNWFGKKLF